MSNDYTIVLKNMYGIQFTPDPKLVKLRDKKVEALKKDMGDKYLLAKPMPRLTKER